MIDPLIEFLPGGAENAAAHVTDFLRSLRRFTSVGMAMLILHHPRKGRVLEGQAARGTSALTGFVGRTTAAPARHSPELSAVALEGFCEFNLPPLSRIRLGR